MRELRPLTPDRVGDLVGSCAPCTFWQTVPRNGHSDPSEPLVLLAEWVESVTADWGPPGRIAYVDGQPAGHVVVAPARHVARLAAFPTSPSDPSTLMLVTAVTTPEYAGRGLRKALVQSAAKDALRHRVRSLEAVAARPLAVSRHACVLDVGFLEKVGFRVERDHPAYPRLRIDLRTVVTLRDEAAAAIARALDRVPGVRPVPESHPSGSSHAHVSDRD
ncbi:GNAT family N-acetyltransferase [Terrabacter sp. Soil810]|uniref:GNAT family N-acetyltransferase n=1 Tax=Terrabacter sp. Soil810 TaxID=1736418 RepID=UPI0007101934|nr:GNAT family N-acetyltransferase [Terrabacter sp. Soil810]KRF38202.1 GCN5 family acetyltransferase [Terrabacter sp. Soil810]